MKKIITISLLGVFSQVSAQDNLINAVSGNRGMMTDKVYQFTDIINLESTGVKNQGKSGTCWSYAMSSFLESEMAKNKKQPVDLAEIFIARHSYFDKAVNYVRMHGNVEWGDGGQLHDVTNAYKKYGIVPQYVYTGLLNGATMNNFEEMQKELKPYLDELIKMKRLPDNWRDEFNAKLDKYLGVVPETFIYNGVQYTPKSFAEQVVGLDKENYVEMVSYEDQPKYKNVFVAVPDNWSFDYAFNINMDDFITVIDHALKKGYTVGWATDVSEKYFSWYNGLAFVPEKSFEQMTPEEQKTRFDVYWEEKVITPEERQKAFDNYETTDDHGMHIIGLVKDQKGREYYIVKNSWGINNTRKGYLYVTKNFVKYKTTSILVNQKALPKNILKAYKKAK
jgi:hypothetical protein